MKKIFLAFIRFYQKAISPYMGRSCRFYPTCSQYTYEAIKEFGALKGSWLGLKEYLNATPSIRAAMTRFINMTTIKGDHFG